MVIPIPSTPSPWKTKDLIRNLSTGKLYLVLHVVKGYATIITNLSDPTELPPTFTLLPREYYKYARDCDALEKDGKWINDMISL